jgi:hypothetical protein
LTTDVLAIAVEAMRKGRDFPAFFVSGRILMNQAAIDAVFRRKPSRQEAKADAITRVVRDLLTAEAASRDNKTERLRTARLARDAATPPVPEKARRAPARRRR